MFTAFKLSKSAHSLVMTILRSIQAPILKRLIALYPTHPDPHPTPKEKSEPRIFGPQGDTNVFTAINLFKIGAFPGDDHSSLHTGADLEKVDCPLPPTPTPTPPQKRNQNQGSLGPKATQTCLPQSTFSKSALNLGMTILRSIRAPILKRLIALYPPPPPPHPPPPPKKKHNDLRAQG